MIREFGAGSLRVACYPALGLSFAPKVIARYRRIDPASHVTLLVVGSNAVRDMVAAGQVDVGLAADEIDVSRVLAQHFMTTPAVCVMRATHRLVTRDKVRAADLDGEPFIALSPDDTVRRRLERMLLDGGVHPRIVVETQYSEVVCNLALEGVGIGVANAATYRASGFDRPGHEARPLDPAVPFRALILTPADRIRAAWIDALVGAFLEARSEVAAAF